MKFTDLKGRVLEPVVDLQTVIDVQDTHGIDLGNIADADVLQRLYTDAKVQVGILWMTCRESITAAGITDATDFARGLGGDVLAAAIAALEDAILFFYPKPKREALADMLRKMHELDSHALESGRRQTAHLVEAAKGRIDETIRELVDKAIAELTPSGSATNSPPSPASASPPAT